MNAEMKFLQSAFSPMVQVLTASSHAPWALAKFQAVNTRFVKK